MNLPVATDDTAVITAWCVGLLRRVSRAGYRYVKAGVMLDSLRPKSMAQGSLFDALPPASDLRRERLMTVLDCANRKWGRGSLGIGSAGVRGERDWTMQRSMLSPCYTTDCKQVRAVT